MKTSGANPIGVLWVTFVFLSLPVALYFGAYQLESRLLRISVVGVASSVVTFSVSAVLFWVSHLRPTRLGAGWHRPRAWENQRLYRRLGVGLFRTWLLKSPFRTLNRDVYLRDLSRESVAALKPEIDAAETNHVVGFVVLAVLTFVFGVGNTWEFIPWLIALNLAANVYPVLLQRQVRLRVLAIAARSDKRLADSAISAGGGLGPGEVTQHRPHRLSALPRAGRPAVGWLHD